MKIAQFILFTLALFYGGTAFGQKLLKGHISDEEGNSIPFAKIFVKNSADLRTLADADGYYEMRLYPDEYFLYFSATGYETRETYVTISETEVVKDMILFPTKIQDIEDVEVSAKRSNPGREIMLKVVKKRDEINPWKHPHTVHVYIKATEKIERKGGNKSDEKEEKKKKRAKEDEAENTDPDGIEDPFAEKRKEDEKFANSMNLIEVDLTRHYGSKSKVKEIRNGFEQRGSKRNNLYYTTTVKSNFNFFKNFPCSFGLRLRRRQTARARSTAWN